MIEILSIEEDTCFLDRGLWLLFDMYNLQKPLSDFHEMLTWFPIFMNFGASIIVLRDIAGDVIYKVIISEDLEDIFFLKLRDYLDDNFLYFVF